jgi:EAL domain-containing protein (putative c-di-GMP-specific phosphodiesterase class I)
MLYPASDRARGYLLKSGPSGADQRHDFLSLSVAIVHNDAVPLRTSSEVSRIAGELRRYMKELPGSCYIDYRRSGEGAAAPVRLEARFPSLGRSVVVSGPKSQSDRTVNFFQKILKGRRIRTVFQPIIDLKTREVVGYEALTRALSDYPVDEATLLFTVARETGSVKELDRLCLEFALKNAQSIPRGLKLFLNLNIETLLDGCAAKDVAAFRGRIDPKNIVIEVTEQSLLRSFDRMREALADLRAAGVSVAIDDVGGGAVSLRDVAILRPDYIKFDRSLIRQLDRSEAKQQIVLSLILFAGGIRAQTAAEGIETPEEFETARMCGADLGQGYYIARPGEPFPKLSI